MNVSHRLATIALAALTAVTLAGCTPSSDDPNAGTYLYYREYVTNDGRRIPCIVYVGSNRGGLSCDWEHPITSKKGTA